MQAGIGSVTKVRKLIDGRVAGDVYTHGMQHDDGQRGGVGAGERALGLSIQPVLHARCHRRLCTLGRGMDLCGKPY